MTLLHNKVSRIFSYLIKINFTGINIKKKYLPQVIDPHLMFSLYVLLLLKFPTSLFQDI